MDYNIIGIGIAVTFAIIALSAITLYLAFRIKETFREEKSLKTQVAKIGFLIGILFLAGGMFYFFANAMYQPEKLQNGSNGTSNLEEYAKNTSVVLGVSYPDNVKVADKYTVSFKVYNPFPRVIHHATIELAGLSLSEAKSNFNIDSGNLNLGDISSGETSGYLQLEAPSYPVTLEGTLILKSEDIDPVIETVKINVLDSATTPSPTPTPRTSASPAPTERPWYYPDINIIWPPSSTSAPTPTVAPMPSSNPTETPIANPTSSPTPTPTPTENITSSHTPTPAPTENVTSTPTENPTLSPTENVTSTPTENPTPSPTANTTSTPTETPTASPTPSPTANTTSTPTETPTASPTPSPTPSPTENITSTPTETPTANPTPSPTENVTSSSAKIQRLTQRLPP